MADGPILKIENRHRTISINAKACTGFILFVTPKSPKGPLGDLGVTNRIHLWLNGKRTVDFLLAIIELFSLARAGLSATAELLVLFNKLHKRID